MGHVKVIGGGAFLVLRVVDLVQCGLDAKRLQRLNVDFHHRGHFVLPGDQQNLKGKRLTRSVLQHTVLAHDPACFFQ